MASMLERDDRDIDGTWLGRTQLRDGQRGLITALFDARRDWGDATINSVPVFESWTAFNHDLTQPAEYTTDDDFTCEAHGSPVRPDHLTDVPWRPIRPPEPQYTAPIPLDLYLPVDHNDTPIPDLKPWWDHLRVTGIPPAGTLAGFTGTTSNYGTHRGITWERGPRATYGKWAALYATDTSLTSLVTYEANRREPELTVGCTVQYSYIHAITAWLSYANSTPVFGSPEAKAAMNARGYGMVTDYTITVNLTDGWRPYQISLDGKILKYEQETSLIQFASWLTRHVAYNRAHHPWVTPTQRTELESIAATEPAAQFRPRNRRLGVQASTTLRTVIPGTIPISVPLDQ